MRQQYHYVIGFDTETNKWFVDHNEDAYMPDGNVWDKDMDDAGEYGWNFPDDEMTTLIDQRCRNMLNALVTIWPAVDTEAYA